MKNKYLLAILVCLGELLVYAVLAFLIVIFFDLRNFVPLAILIILTSISFTMIGLTWKEITTDDLEKRRRAIEEEKYKF